MALSSKHAFVAGAALIALTGCYRTFNLRQYPNNEALYAAGVQQLQQKKWDYAVQIFEKLTKYDAEAKSLGYEITEVDVKVVPVTNYSARINGGACQNLWPSGNTLSQFVTIYRP